MTVRINKQKINLREKLTEFEDKVNFDEVVRGLGEYTGNVGIGTSSPQSPLHVYNSKSSACRLYLQNLSSSDYFDTCIYSQNSDLVFDAGRNPRMRITSTGNVGIGTTNPFTNLEVLTNAGTYSETEGISNYGVTINDPNQSSLNLYHGSAGSALSRIVSLRTSSGNSQLAFITQNSVLGRTEKMRIDNNGNVGIGTTSPDFNLSVVSNTDPAKIGIHGYGSFSDGTVAAQLLFLGKDSNGNNRNLAHIQVREHSHAFGTGSMEFFTRKGGNEAARMTISYAGNVGIGTTDPGNARLAINHTSSDRIIVTRSFSTDSQYHHVFQNSSGTTVGNILVSTTGTSYVQNSDYRLKENVVPIDDAISRVKQLKPSRFNFIIDADNTVDGFLAHEVQEVVPQAITGEKDAVNPDGDPEYQGIDQSKLVPLLTAAIQEQQAIIEDLKSRIETLESK